MAELTNSFEDMYKAHYKQLRNASENIIGDHEAAHDLVQEVFIKLWGKRDELHVILNLKAYLFKSVINASITYLESNKGKVRLGELKIESGGRTDSGLLTKELESKIQSALNSLPAKCKAIFILSRFENLKNKEIADCLGLSLKTFENQMGIALKKMRDDLRPYFQKEFFSLIFFSLISFLIKFIIFF